MTEWDCPVDASSIKAFYEVDVEAKRARGEGDVGERTGIRRLRSNAGEGSSKMGGNIPTSIGTEDEPKEDERRIARVHKSGVTPESQADEDTKTRQQHEPKGKEPV